MRINPDGVGREKVPRTKGIPGPAPARLEIASPVENAHAPTRRVRAGSSGPRPHPRVETQFGHQNVFVPVDEHLTRPRDIPPFPKVLAVRREKLNATILAVSHVDGPLPVHGDPVRNLELTRTASDLPPGEKQPPLRRELVNPRIAVPIADV